MQVTDVVLLPLIVGLVELFKYFRLPKRLVPIVSVALGILGGIYYIYPDDLKSGILIGLIMGLSACGMYSGRKAIIEKNQEPHKAP